MGKGTNTTTQTQSNSPNPAAMAAYNSILDRAQGVANTPYQAYGGELTAGLNQQQQAGIGAINQNAGFASPYISEAAGYARQGAAPISAEDIARYQDPYTQQVVNATQAQFNNQNQQQQSSLLGNAAARGALGGDRTGVAQANLAGQQSLAQSPVIAGLYSQGYGQALSAAQRQQQQQGNAAGMLGNLGVAGQQAGLAGSQAMLGAGSLEQQTEQQRLNALYQQFQIQQAFPYQQTQWLAGVGSGIGSQMGSTSTGTTTKPAPDQTAQYLGAGLSAASMFLSDRRAKDDIEQIGTTNDGLAIYRFRYSGRPETQIGLMADEVEKKHPEAVAGFGGTKFVDYRAATDDAARPGFAEGGAPVMPYGGVQGYVPTMSISPGRGMPGLGAMPGDEQQPKTDYDKLGKAAGDVASKGWERWNQGAPLDLTSGFGASGQMGDVVPISWGSTAGMSGIYASGGAVYEPGGYDDGGLVDPAIAGFEPTNFGDRYAAAYSPPPPGVASLSFAERAAPVNEAVQSGTFDPQGRNYSTYEPPRAPAVVSDAGVIPQPRQRPEFLPPPRSEPVTPPQSAPVQGFAPQPAPVAAESPQRERGFGLGFLSPAAQQGLMAAGLGMMASRSPHLGSAIGEGGLAGLQAYTGARENERSAAEKKVTQAQQDRRINLEVDRLAQHAREASERIGISRETLAESRRQHAAQEEKPIVVGGSMVDRKGNVIYKSSNALLDDDTVRDMAGQYLSGDKSVMQNLGRGAQGAENIIRLRSEISRQAREAGLTPDQVATKMADFAGRTAAMRSLGTRGVNVEYAANTALRAIDLADEAIDKLPRTMFVPFNKLRELYDKNTSSPEQAAAYAATNTLVNEYARVASGGSAQATEGMRHHAREMLNTAMDQKAYKAVTNMMRREIASAKAAYHDTRKEFLEDKGPGKDGHGAPSPASTPSAVPPAAEREKNKVYQTPKGPKKWTGSGWVEP